MNRGCVRIFFIGFSWRRGHLLADAKQTRRAAKPLHAAAGLQMEDGHPDLRGHVRSRTYCGRLSLRTGPQEVEGAFSLAERRRPKTRKRTTWGGAPLRKKEAGANDRSLSG